MGIFDLESMFTADEIAAMGSFDGMFTSKSTENAELSLLNKDVPRPESPWNEDKLNEEACENEKQTQGPSWSKSAFYDDYNDEPSAGNSFANSTLFGDSEQSAEPSFAKSPYVDDYDEEQSASADEDYESHHARDSTNSTCHPEESNGSKTPKFDFLSFLNDEYREALNSIHPEKLFTDQLEEHHDTEQRKFDFASFLSADEREVLNSLHPEDWFTKKDNEPVNLNFPKDHFYPSVADAKSKLNLPVRKVHQAATLTDVVRWKLPPGALISRWDPSEQPIMLLGTVFDAFSLGKWIFDWAYECYGIHSHITEQAVDLWRLLVKLAGKVKHAKQVVAVIREKHDRAMIQDFIKSADRQWIKLRKLLQACEEPMLDTLGEEEAKLGREAKLGKEAGIVFINTFFGEGQLLKKVDRLMDGIDLWSFRMNANCEEVLSAQPE